MQVLYDILGQACFKEDGLYMLDNGRGLGRRLEDD